MAEIEFKLTGDLGHMPFLDVLATLSNAYDMLVAVQRQVLGPKADGVAWALSGLRGGSAVAVLHAGPSDEVGAADLESVVLAFGTGAQALMSGADTAPEYFADDALVAYRKLVGRLRNSDVGDLVASAGEISVTVAGVADEPPALRLVDAEFTVEGSVVGQLDVINVHGDKREASLWSDLDKVRVRVSFPEVLYARIHDALRHRVEVAGRLVEDAQGRPKRITATTVEVLAAPGGLPTLASLVGAAPDLTAGRPAADWLSGRRASMGIG